MTELGFCMKMLKLGKSYPLHSTALANKNNIKCSKQDADIKCRLCISINFR